MPIYFPSASEQALYERIATALDSSKTELPLSEIVDGDWDTVCVVGPYTSFADIPEPRVREMTDYLYEESVFAIVSLDGTEDPQVIRVKRGQVDTFSSMDKCFVRSDEPIATLVRTHDELYRPRTEMEISTRKDTE